MVSPHRSFTFLFFFWVNRWPACTECCCCCCFLFRPLPYSGRNRVVSVLYPYGYGRVLYPVPLDFPRPDFPYSLFFRFLIGRSNAKKKERKTRRNSIEREIFSRLPSLLATGLVAAQPSGCPASWLLCLLARGLMAAQPGGCPA